MVKKGIVNTSYPTLLVLVSFCAVIGFPSQSWGGEFPYECQSVEEFYESTTKAYTEAQSGAENKNYFSDQIEWISEGCLWRYGGIKPQLRDLSEKMLRDPRLHDSAKTNTAIFYAKAFGPDAFLLNYLEKASDGPRRALVREFLERLDPNFNYAAFLKKQIIKESDPAARQGLIEFYGARYIQDFESLRAFCEYNKIPLTLQVIIQYPQLNALDYLFQHRDLLSEKIKRYTDGSNRYGTLSRYILAVLGKHLEIVFPQETLNVMSFRDLRFLRNGIYATYGKNFKSKILQYHFFGEYSYVQDYCRHGKCGLGQRAEGQFQESDLTNVDKANIEQIAKIEEERRRLGKQEPNFFIENYDYKSFVNGTADNLTLASFEIQELREYKLDWDHRQVWIWDKHGVSGWDLTSEKRIKLIKHARGPLYLSKEKRLIVYQVGEQLVLENVDTGKVVHKETVHADFVKDYQMPYYLPEDGRYFIFFNIPVNEPRWGMKRLTIINLENNERREIKFDFNPSFNYLNSHLDTARPFVIAKGNWLIGILDQNPYDTRGGAFLLVPLEKSSGNKIKVLSYRADYTKYHLFFTMIISSKGTHLVNYLCNEGPIQVYKVSDIINAENSMPDPIYTAKLPLDKYAVNYMLDVFDDLVYVAIHNAESNSISWFPISNIEGIQKAPITASFDIRTTSVSVNNKIFAQGDRRGFVVLRRF